MRGVWTIPVSEYNNILFIKVLAEGIKNMLLVSAYIPEWSLLVSANISVQSSIAHVLLPLLFVADKNPSQGAATTITAVCFDPSILRYRAAEKRGSSLSEVTVRSSIDANEQCQDASKALRNQLWELSSEKEIKVELQKWSNLMCMTLKGMDGW